MRLNPRQLGPGALVSLGVSVLAVGAGWLEGHATGRPIVEPLVLAILFGMVVRTVRGAREREEPGVRFIAKDVLEIAVLLLGATMDIPRLFAAGPSLAAGIALLVATSLVLSYFISRFSGLPHRLSVLVACGNSICGNSAIAAVAPVIGAEREDVAASIALTAVLGVFVVLGLPLLAIPLGYSHYQYGVLAGLTVYAVPQVLAAAFAVSVVSGQVATAVKLGRVLMLGPVVTFFAVRQKLTQEPTPETREAKRDVGLGSRVWRYVPWFVSGFVVLAALRSTHVIADAVSNQAKLVASWLTMVAMAALGLSVDLRSVRQVGARVAVAVGGSLIAIIALAIGLIRLLALQ